jgi:hypothetical protein
MRKHSCAALFTLLIAISALAADKVPSVTLNADQIGPRAPIEELTGRNITRDYARAWQSLAQALEENRPQLLEGYIAGFAKDNLARRIAEHKKSGLHVVTIDHGHTLVAGFYAPNGDAMQLHDTAQLEIQVFDGSKMIQQETVAAHYLVLMTPAADRWVVRLLEEVPGGTGEARPEGQ